MKIKMFSVRHDEQPAIQQWAKEHNAHIETTSDDFKTDTINQANGFEVVVIAQHGPFGGPFGGPEVYQQLADMGIHHIALRMTGYDIVDFKAADENGIVVTNVPGYSPRSVAEEALAHTMIHVRHIEEAESRMREHNYSWDGLESYEIHNLTVGILGAGKIGSTVARIFKALGARVIANDIVQRPELADTLDYVSFDELLDQSDVLTVHTNLDSTTHHIINEATFKKMKDSAIFINCARGPIVDTKALLDAIESGEIAAAGLDTLEGEEKVIENDLRGTNQDVSLFDRVMALPNVSLTPHIGFYTDAAVQNMVTIALNDIDLIYHGQPSPHIVHD
ncbi:D-2-hydroxyacid dehydrogenase [Weissella viridescens]|uniref:D-2-hydroxyacid dehydrogenase n=2 Tax=Weissella viridescens TaxID=1629 RepID=A0A3P2RDP5_WEIVI|nr:D-2-hydroxyacid dehydrogenase [Weissella viridescens]